MKKKGKKIRKKNKRGKKNFKYKEAGKVMPGISTNCETLLLLN
jgi:hypothetical protein